jgi:large repetitive protein
LTPPGTSLLTLNATSSATTGSATLDLSAEGGGITNTVTPNVSVSFGLLPICYGAVGGTVTDVQTGLPVPYASVFSYGGSAVANAQGQYLITDIPLSSSENLPVDYSFTASQSNYWANSGEAYAVCDATNTLDIQLTREQFGSISGTLTAQGGGPITNITVTASTGYNYFYATTDPHGNFVFTNLILGNDNTPNYYSLSSQPSGYWDVYSNTYVYADSNSVVDLVAIPVCTVTVTGSVIYGNTGQPASNITVSVNTVYSYPATTDANGDFTITNVTLNTDNNPINAEIYANATGYYEGYTNIELSSCSVESNGAPPLRLVQIPPPPTNNYGALQGHVYDIQTGLPIAYAEVYSYYYGYGETDSNGFYSISNILVGTGSTTNATIGWEATATGYFEGYSNIVIDANET